MINNFRYIVTVLALIALILSGCDSFDPTGPELEDNVETISKWNVDLEVGDKSNLVSFKKFDPAGNLMLHEEYHNSGRLASRAEFSYENNKSYEVITYFDESGVQLETENCSYTYSNDKIIEKALTDTIGNVLKVIKYDYNSDGRLIKSTETDLTTGSSTSFRYNYQFNQNGNLVERTSFTDEGDVRSRDSLNYSGNLNTVEVINFNSAGSINIVHTYIYDFRGLVQTETQTNPAGEIIKKFIFEYTFH